jgi:hypothetical protein
VSDNEILDLAAIEARLKAATPGPWRWADWHAIFGTWEDPKNRRVLEQNPRYDFRNSMIIPEKDVRTERVIDLADIREVYKEADLELIEHAPTDVAALVAEVHHLRREFNKLAKSSYDQIIDKRFAWSRDFEPPYPDEVEE